MVMLLRPLFKFTFESLFVLVLFVPISGVTMVIPGVLWSGTTLEMSTVSSTLWVRGVLLMP